MGGCPILWKTHKEGRISRSSCEAEVKATDEGVKIVQMFRHVLSDLQVLDTSLPTKIFNDNRGCVDWSNSFSTKGMRHVNIRENAVREARLHGKYLFIIFLASLILPTYLPRNLNRILLFGLCVVYFSSIHLHFLPDFAPCLDGGYQLS
jgi:hypothetical protein